MVECKCTNCGSVLSVSSDKDAAICEFCGSAFVVDKAINNYNISNNITAEVVNIIGTSSADFQIRAGVLVKYNGAETDVIVPSTVTHIGQKAFKGCVGLRSVVLPDSVTTICEEAFKECKGLTTITIPDSVIDIEYEAFADCTSLTSVRLPQKLTAISTGLFMGCSKLKSLTIPDTVVSICPNAFQYCYELSDINFPAKLNYIGNMAFNLCTSLDKINLPDTFTSLGYDDPYAFGGGLCGSSITEFTIPAGVTKILPNTFRNCDELFSITIHDNVKEFAEDALVGCDNLKVICASEQWKKAHWNIHPLLESYAPKKKGCYVATAVYGSYDCPQVWTLRRYRDYTLQKSYAGRCFVRLYYAVSPFLVEKLGDKAFFKRFCKKILDKITRRLNTKGYSQAPYND